MMIGDSISMGGSGYSLFVQDMLQTYTNGTLAGSVQHGGGFGGGGQMASSSNGAAKVASCMGNATGTLKPKAWSVITYNAGLHDCDTREFVPPDKYAANLKAIFETLKPAASTVLFVTTTPYDMPLTNGTPPYPAGINMSCVVHYNAIARGVVAEVGGIGTTDLYGYVERFCQHFHKDPAGSGYSGNYTDCAIQTTGLHFFNNAPAPSGQQYTGLAVAQALAAYLPEAAINNRTRGYADALALLESPEGSRLTIPTPRVRSCGAPPAPLSQSRPNVLIIGDSISEPGSGYGPGVKRIFEMPGQPFRPHTGPIAAVQHNGNTGNTQAGPTPNGVACIDAWLGTEKWDAITINFGIHDCCPGGDGRQPGVNVPLKDYVANLAIIYGKASKALAPGGKILWVSTTPHSVAQPDCGLTGTAFNQCIIDYNAAALKLLKSKPDVEVLDLNAAVNQVCGTGYSDCNLQLWHNVHFTTAGKQFCAVHVAAAVAPLLAPKWAVLDP